LKYISNNVKISIIIPVYNVKEYLVQCVESLVNQSLSGMELIFVDDASTDASADILIDYQSKYPNLIKVILLEKNIKQGGARNSGLKLAQGDYIGFVDSDDWVATNMYELLYEKATSGGYDVVDCDLEVNTGKETIEYQKSLDNNLNDSQDLTRELILNYGRLVTKIFKRKFFDKNGVGLVFKENLFYEDNHIAPLLALNTESIGKVESALYYYRVNLNSTTRKRNDIRVFDRLKSAQLMIDDFKKEVGNKFQDEIEFKFIELYGINSMKMFLTLFDEIPKDEITKIKTKLNEMNFSTNGYYNKLLFSKKFIFILSLYRPSLVKFIYNIYFKLKEL
jgi:glycosyltransferase involved in cell wall biosynthesis